MLMPYGVRRVGIRLSQLAARQRGFGVNKIKASVDVFSQPGTSLLLRALNPIDSFPGHRLMADAWSREECFGGFHNLLRIRLE
jgi:hypothetical protein